MAAHWLDPNNWCLPMHDFDAECFEGILQMHTEKVHFIKYYIYI